MMKTRDTIEIELKCSAMKNMFVSMTLSFRALSSSCSCSRCTPRGFFFVLRNHPTTPVPEFHACIHSPPQIRSCRGRCQLALLACSCGRRDPECCLHQPREFLRISRRQRSAGCGRGSHESHSGGDTVHNRFVRGLVSVGRRPAVYRLVSPEICFEEPDSGSRASLL